MDYIARVNPQFLAAMTCFAGIKDARPYINGVLITPHHQGGVIIVGTNGHVMAAIHDKDGYASRDIIVPTPSKAVLAACKKKGKPGQAAERVWIGADCIVVSTSREVEPEPGPFAANTLARDASPEIAGWKYPDWRRVLPVDVQQEESHQGGALLGTTIMQPFLDAAAVLGATRKTGSGVRIIFRGPAAGAIIRYEFGGLERLFVGMAMPMRSDFEKLPLLPAWLTAPVPKPKPRHRVAALVD